MSEDIHTGKKSTSKSYITFITRLVKFERSSMGGIYDLVHDRIVKWLVTLIMTLEVPDSTGFNTDVCCWVSDVDPISIAVSVYLYRYV